MAETACFRCSNGPHVIDTEIGKIGIGICADNLFVPNLHKMQVADADILLMPHAAPVAYRSGGFVQKKDLAEGRLTLSQMAPNYLKHECSYFAYLFLIKQLYIVLFVV